METPSPLLIAGRELQEISIDKVSNISTVPTDVGIPSPIQTREDLRAITVPPDVEKPSPPLVVRHEDNNFTSTTSQAEITKTTKIFPQTTNKITSEKTKEKQPIKLVELRPPKPERKYTKKKDVVSNTKTTTKITSMFKTIPKTTALQQNQTTTKETDDNAPRYSKNENEKNTHFLVELELKQSDSKLSKLSLPADKPDLVQIKIKRKSS